MAEEKRAVKVQILGEMEEGELLFSVGIGHADSPHFDIDTAFGFGSIRSAKDYAEEMTNGNRIASISIKTEKNNSPDPDWRRKTEAFIQEEKKRLLKKKAELAHVGDIQGFLLIDRDIETMEITARRLRRFVLEA